MQRLFRMAPILSIVTIVMVGYSVILAGWAVWLGIAWGSHADPWYSPDPDSVPGYFRKLNWVLFPLYWPIIALLIHFSWKLYMEGWRSLPSEGVLYRQGAQTLLQEEITPILDYLTSWRVLIAIVSIGVGIILTTIDGFCLLQEYGVIGYKECSAKDFTIAFRLQKYFPEFSSQDKTILGFFVVAQYLMQGILIGMSFIVLFQLLLHSFVFLLFEHFHMAISQALAIRLNIRDMAREFGLSKVNEAVNFTYIFIAIGMSIPVLSVMNKPDRVDAGRLLMAIFLPLLLGLPAAIPLLERILRRRAARVEVKAIDTDEIWKLFREQKLWPMMGTPFAWLGAGSLVYAASCWAYVAAPYLPPPIRGLLGG